MPMKDIVSMRLMLNLLKFFTKKSFTLSGKLNLFRMLHIRIIDDYICSMNPKISRSPFCIFIAQIEIQTLILRLQPSIQLIITVMSLSQYKFIMSKSAQIDYKAYAAFMRGALSGPQICNKDNTLNHTYFNTKKGFYWSEKHNQLLIQGVTAHDLDILSIREQMFKNNKTEVQLELRICLLFNVKQIKNISEKDLKEFKKAHANGNSHKK